jgi:ubiquinone/menaquinone biosynthesis C-methylase UbiE
MVIARDLPKAILDWQPEAESFSIRRLLRHIGNAEEWYVSRIVQTETLPSEWKDDENMPILDFLEMERRTAIARLCQLTEAERSNVFYPQQWTQHPEEPWTARKAFRRFLEHEREHTDQIRRILELYHNKQRQRDQEAHLSTEHDNPIEAVRHLYDQQPIHEWERMDRHRTEFAVTLRALRDHLPPPPARVLDCGSGPGRYSIELAKRGYDVTLFDLSPECLRLAERKAAEAQIKLSALEHGTATDLARFADNTFDVVLLMGPLYHLLEEHERLQALAEARRVLRPGGTLFATFITRYAPFRYAAADEPDFLIKHLEEAERILSTGVLPPREGGGFIAYFTLPAEVGPLVARSGFRVVTILGVEGLVSQIEDGINALSGPAWEAWVDLNYRVAADPSIHGGAEHLLVIALRPR